MRRDQSAGNQTRTTIANNQIESPLDDVGGDVVQKGLPACANYVARDKPGPPALGRGGAEVLRVARVKDRLA